MSELELSRLAAEQARSPAVRAFARHMVQDHAQNASELEIIAAHENITLPETVSDEHAQLRNELTRERGSRFDNTYMNAMLTDHQALARVLRASEAAVSTDELRAYVRRTLSMLELHLRMADDIPIQ